MFITWTDTHSINVKLLDEQHKELIQLANRLFDLINETPESRDPEIGSLLKDLIDFTNLHFMTEEDLMKKYDYPDAAVQKEDHESLRGRVLSLQKQYYNKRLFSEKNTGVVLELLEIIKEWLLNHLLEKDMKLGDFLNSKGVA